MTTNQTADGPIRFQGWELRPQERLLLVHGAPVPVGGRAFEILLTLVARRGRVVTKSELLDAAWPHLAVEENNISVQIAALRKVLGRKVIATIAGHGYQLSAVTVVGAEAKAPVPEHLAGPELLPELIGRQKDLAELIECVAASQFVTVVGTGGVGKTTLAREVFARRCALVQQAGHWIDLAPVQGVRQVAGLLAKALGVELGEASDGADALAAALSHMVCFVALDNCEHMAAEVARITSLALQTAPGVRWLATSQAPLHVPGELVYRLDPLTVPSARTAPLQALEFGAIALLCKRVAEADRRFRLDNDNIESAIDLCTRLDGLPLAIEMAAARVATFGLEEVCLRVGQRMKLLTAGQRPGSFRHAALKDMYDWSYGLLSPVEQAVFRRLAPFLNGFRSDMAQQVTSDTADGGVVDAWQALDALGTLIDKSLVQRTQDAPGRFHLLESARDYARARLQEAGEFEAVQRRHALAVAGCFADAQADADRMADAQWIRHYTPERHNARSALDWAARHGAADALAQLATALAMMDWLLCRQAEILACHVPLEVLAQASPKRRAGAYLELSWAHFSDGDHALGAQLAQDAFDTFVALGETALAYRALAQITRLHETRPSMAEEARAAWSRLQQFDDRSLPLRTRLFCAISAGLLYRPDLTIARTQELGRLAEDAGFDAIAAICGCNLTDKLLIAGRHAEVVATTDRLLRTVGHLARACAFMLHNKAAALIRMGRFHDAYEPAQLAFQTMPAVAHFLVDTFALGAVREGRFADAAVLHGCGANIRGDLHEQPDVSEAEAIAETAARLQAAMVPAQLAELMVLGAAMTAREALTIKVFTHAPPPGARAAPAAGARDPASSLGVA